MKTLMDLAQEVTKIRETVNLIEVHGKNNATLVVYAHNKCDEIIQEINSIVTAIQNGTKEAVEGEVTDGEPNSGISEQN